MLFHLIHLKNVPIFEQLLLEETLLRTDSRNFCILNEGSNPAVVMGISGDPLKLVDPTYLQALKVPLLRRFSGGGTVIVDENTLFVSFLCNREELGFPPYPEQILQWTETLYQQALKIPSFHLKEHDFVIGDHNCGGNAQYIRKDRWIQHTSFLWDFSSENMKTLLHPPKTPSYRQGRNHEQFLCKLKDHLPHRTSFFSRIKDHLHQTYTLQELFSIEELLQQDRSDVRISTQVVQF